MSHLRSCGEVNSRSIFGFQLFYLNLGSTPSLTPVQSMSKLRSCGGLTPDLDPALKPYLCSTFLGSIPYPAPVPSMSHLRSCGGSTPDVDPVADQYLCCTFQDCTPSLAPVPSISHLRSCGSQLWFWIQLQIHIWVVTF